MRRILAALLLLWLLPSVPAQAAIGTPVLLGQVATATGTQLVISSTAAAVSAHDLIIIIFYTSANSGAISSVTDTAGNTYVNAPCTSCSRAMGMAYVADALAMSSGSNITVNFGTSLKYGMAVIDVPGGTLTSGGGVYDYRANPISAASNLSGTTFTQTTLPLGSNIEVGICFAAWGASPGTITAPGGSWSASLTNLAANVWLATYYQIVATNTAVTCTPSWVNTAGVRGWVGMFRGIPASNTSRQTQSGLLGVGQ